MSTPAGPGGDTADSPTYYDRPVLKEPVWIWSVPAYFHAGGTAAGAVAVGAAARLLSGDEHADLVTTCRRLAAAGNVAGTALLIHDLGRPARFLHMLRVFRPTSAMSMGSWSLAASTGLTVAAAVLPADGAGAGRLGDVAGYGAAVLAPVQSTYTAVLLADTAVPLWRATDRRLPPLFAASALAGAGAALELLAGDGATRRVARRLGILAGAAELVAGEAVERAADRHERVGRPLREGRPGRLWCAAKALTAAAVAVRLVPVPRRWQRARDAAAGLLGTAAGLSLRFAVVEAGAASARDPRASFEPQRARSRGGRPPEAGR